MLPAIQSVQSAHAAIQFQHEHPSVSRNWMKHSQYLIFLSVSDKTTLIELIDKFNENGLRMSIFREPDIDNQITAIAVEPSDITRKLTSNLPLMLKELNINKNKTE